MTIPYGGEVTHRSAESWYGVHRLGWYGALGLGTHIYHRGQSSDPHRDRGTHDTYQVLISQEISSWALSGQARSAHRCDEQVHECEAGGLRYLSQYCSWYPGV